PELCVIVGVPAMLITTSFVDVGTNPPLQLAAVCQELSPAAPVQPIGTACRVQVRAAGTPMNPKSLLRTRLLTTRRQRPVKYFFMRQRTLCRLLHKGNATKGALHDYRAWNGQQRSTDVISTMSFNDGESAAGGCPYILIVLSAFHECRNSRGEI